MGNSLLMILELLAAMLLLIPLNGLIINALSYLGQRFKLKRELIVIIIIGIAVSLPELLIAVNAVQMNQPEVALGNTIGTGLVLLSLVAGIIAIYNKNFRTNNVFKRSHLVYMSLACCLNIVLAFDGRISRTDGVILILAYLVYLVLLVANKNQFSIAAHNDNSQKKLWLNLGVVVFGLLAAYFTAYFLNYTGRQIYQNSNFSLFFIGLILIAPLGAIPELIFELELNRRGKSTLTLGELFTSLVTNTTLVIGITSVLAPINISTNIVYYYAAFFFILLLCLLNYFLHSKNSLDRREGLILIVAYIIFLLSAVSLAAGQI